MADDERTGIRLADWQEGIDGALDEEDRVTPGGSVIYEYADPILHGPAECDPVLGVEVEQHVTRHLGPVEEVFHEPFAEVVEIEVLRVPPSEDRPYNVLITCGMAQRPMTVPDDCAEWSHAELLMTLPPDWSFDEDDLEGEDGWPIRLLRDLARFPHQYLTWLGLDHTVPNGEPAEPYALGSLLAGCILERPVHLPDDFFRLGLSDGRGVHFLHVTPLYAEEMDYKLSLGADSLLERFDHLKISMVVDPRRPSVVHPELPGSFGAARTSEQPPATPWWRQVN